MSVAKREYHMITSNYHVTILGYASFGAVHSSVSLTVSSWESGTGMDLGPGA